MEHKLSKLKQFQHVTLHDEERAYLRGRIAAVVSAPIPSGMPLFQRGMQHGLRIALSSFFFVIFVGGGISAVASSALPGDPLYLVKTEFNERVKEAFLTTPEEKVAWQKSRVEERVGEIKTLAATKTLTKEKQAKAQKALNESIEDLSAELSVLSEESPNTALSVTANLEQNIKADKEAIVDALSEASAETATATLKSIDGTLKKVSQQEVKILSKELENITKELDETSTDATDGIDPQNEEEDEDGENVLGESTTNLPSNTPVIPTPVSP